MKLRVIAGVRPGLEFVNPDRVWAPVTFEDALAALRDADDALDSGYWIAGAIAYEFGARLQGLDARSFEPFLLLGAFRAPTERAIQSSKSRFSLSAPLPRVTADEYAADIAYILKRIADGEVYQVNYTVPFDAGFSGDPVALFDLLSRRAKASYSALVQYGTAAIVSISPELFLRFDEDMLSAKPMKGTAAPEHTQALDSEKNRAEHLMIVDLLRNDLRRFCTDVRVRQLFEVERYPTFSTMTSTIEGRFRGRPALEAILRATFPCGSVTGAPKRAAMQHIQSTERDPRGFYTGTVGYLSPNRRGWWNVPIRTLQLDLNAGLARYDAGGGIVSDSNAADEWNEVLIKSMFLKHAYRDFELLETFRSGSGETAKHLRRLRRSADEFGMSIDEQRILERLRDIEGRNAQIVRLRLGFDGLRVKTERLEPVQEPVRLCVSQFRVRAADPFLRYKTAWRPIHDAAALEARARKCFDAILQNERGELTEGSRTNLFVRTNGTLSTPPIESGVLPGILRTTLLERGRAVERVLTVADLAQADAIYAGNSARGLLLARME